MPPTLPPPTFASSASSSLHKPLGNIPFAAPSDDPSEITATAQALLSAHYGRLSSSSDSSSLSSTSSSSTSLSANTAQLAKLEAASRNIDAICLQLDNLQIASQLHRGNDASADRMLQPLGPLAFFPAKVALYEDMVWVRHDPDGLTIVDLLRLEDQVLPMLTQCPDKAEDGVRQNLKLTEPNRTIQVVYKRVPVRTAQMALQARKSRYLAEANKLRDQVQGHVAARSRKASEVIEQADENVHMTNEAGEVLNEEGLPFYEPVEQISEGEANRNKQAYMQPFVPSDELAQDKGKRKQFVDDVFAQLEAEEENESSSSDNDDEVGASHETSAARGVPSLSNTDQSEPGANQETRVVLRTRTPSPLPSPEDSSKIKALPEIVSAARPPPPKSALKPSAARPDIIQRPSFGSAGIRHGFLNLNPSSPGAIESSYSWEDLVKENAKSNSEFERSSRSATPTPLGRNSSMAGSSLLSRVTSAGDASSPFSGSGTSTPTKKSVRIKSPERGSAHPEAAPGSGLTPLQRALRSSIRVKENYSERIGPASSNDTSAATRALDQGSGTAEKRHRDDVGVEEEAERIVKLLGPDVVEGHPAAPPKEVLTAMQAAHEQDSRRSTPEAIAAREKAEEEARQRERLQRLAEKPALGQSVMERPRGRDNGKGKAKDGSKGDIKGVKAANFSAFKAGFLNQRPISATKFVPNPPTARKTQAPPPTQSLGVSALDRASLGDEKLSEQRQALGLSAAVPHARPSKAYAQKIKARQEGTLSSDDKERKEGGNGAVELARPKADDDVPRPGRVRFGAPTTPSNTRGRKRDDDDADGDGDGDGDEEGVGEIDPSAALENYLDDDEIDDGQQMDEEQEEPKIEGEGADTDEDQDVYFDRYLSKKRSRKSAAAESRGLDHNDDFDNGDDDDDDDDDFDKNGFDDEEYDDWDEDDDFDQEDDDEDFDYDGQDIMSLAPSMGGAEGLSGELLREYEEARAKLAALGLAYPGDGGGGHGGDGMREAIMNAAQVGEGEMDGEGEEDDDYEMDVVPLDAAVEDADYQGNTVSSTSGGPQMSRFRKSLAQRNALPSSSQPRNLEQLLSSAKNVGQSTVKKTCDKSAAFGMDGMQGQEKDETARGGLGVPMMIIPQLAPVRFPKNGDLVEGKTSGPVELKGDESDEEDELAEMVMRSRLEQAQWKKKNPEEYKWIKEEKKRKEMIQAGVTAPTIESKLAKDMMDAPAVESTNDQMVGIGNGREENNKLKVKPKKVSRFKAARMGQE
ncbi:uncharacterized protein MEPE_05832 [Melanopsichium pennsylvanicum]|uniref:Uncharacterized protein n=2 Tax=Melanopsichium pennsylvanicum TaxID=63383 RepID=A0AAJ5C7P0_9BASI|nr:putative protein [Melanopsichium pennsylvanicum 4]SNX87122.1 uncharacterized protein MEPE_05832 [Melanopsichium pennsylvanicum]